MAIQVIFAPITASIAVVTGSGRSKHAVAFCSSFLLHGLRLLVWTLHRTQYAGQKAIGRIASSEACEKSLVRGANFLGKQPADRSQNISLSKSNVKFDFNTVRSRVIPILKGIEVKMYPAKIGRVRGWKRQHVAYYVKKLEKAGLIRRLKRSNIIDYELTERGQNFLISCEGVLFSSGVFRLHGLSFVMRCKRLLHYHKRWTNI